MRPTGAPRAPAAVQHVADPTLRCEKMLTKPQYRSRFHAQHALYRASNRLLLGSALEQSRGGGARGFVEPSPRSTIILKFYALHVCILQLRHLALGGTGHATPTHMRAMQGQTRYLAVPSMPSRQRPKV